MTNYGQLMREFRKKYGITQRMMIEETGLSLAVLATTEMGCRALTDDVAEIIRSYFKGILTADEYDLLVKLEK